MGFGTELLLLVVVGFLLLGPKRMQEAFRLVAKAKSKLDETTRELKSQLASEIEGDSARN